MHRHTSIRVHPADRLSIRAGQGSSCCTCGGTDTTQQEQIRRQPCARGPKSAYRRRAQRPCKGQAPKEEALRLGTDALSPRLADAIRFGFRARAQKARAEGVRAQ